MKLSIQKNIKDKIYNIRNKQVMLDKDLAEIYNVKTKALNQAVKRNIERFPKEFMFQLTEDESDNLRSQFVTSRFTTSNSLNWGGRRTHPLAFTEQGIAMLASVLKSKTAVNVSIQIINAFIEMRKLISIDSTMNQRVTLIEHKQFDHDKKINLLFNALEDNTLPKKGIFFDGQIFDAHKFISDIIRSAKSSIILIDNYIDDSTLAIFNKRKKNVNVLIYTKNISKDLKHSLKKHNFQYPEIKIKEFKNSHDRFIIIDEKQVYHLGASIKDLGKKIFAFSKFNKQALQLLNKLGGDKK